MTQIIELQVKSGELVAYPTTLPYQTFPEIMLWGERMFIFSGTYNSKDQPIYREARGVGVANGGIE